MGVMVGKTYRGQQLRLVALVLLVRIAMLAVQRAIGIEWDFHPDAAFYVANIEALRDSGFDALLIDGNFENILYVIVGYAATTLTFQVLDDSTVLIALNIIVSMLTASRLFALTWVRGRSGYSVPVLFFLFSPYLAHVSIHPLKDSLFIYLVLSVFYYIQQRKFAWVAVFSGLVVLSRFYLGVVTVGIMVYWHFGSSMRWRKRTWFASGVIVTLAFYLLSRDLLGERLEVEFEGRSFYPDGLALVPAIVEARLFLGGVLNFLVPFPFIPFSAADAGYFFHWLFFVILAFMGFRRMGKKGIADKNFGLVVGAFFLFSFILTATPGAGPLVRYRLATELILLIALFGAHYSNGINPARKQWAVVSMPKG